MSITVTFDPAAGNVPLAEQPVITSAVNTYAPNSNNASIKAAAKASDEVNQYIAIIT